MSAKRVLGVDDEPRYLKLMKVNLESAGYQFTGVTSAQEALTVLLEHPADILLLDVSMPGRTGFELLEEIREFSDVPAIFVTALGEEADRVRGLKLGADDYLTKPFSAPELLARVEAVLRRYHRGGSETRAQVTVGDLRIDLAQHRVFRGGEEIRLSRTEFRLLACLVRHLGKVVPQDLLVREVWGQFYDESFEGLRVYIYRLRHKIEVDPDRPELLVTFPGVGYVLHAEPVAAPSI
ncbi:MAG: response regulator transcription factor [Chloroflexi bacterium]|nr:response regulator transcription factor [Chloroflexota bacterium]